MKEDLLELAMTSHVLATSTTFGVVALRAFITLLHRHIRGLETKPVTVH